jgi:arylsulfatase A-like enzyme
MVGNFVEWVADWVPLSTDCPPALFAGDYNCLAGASTTAGPGALIRGGGAFDGGTLAGVFAVAGFRAPSFSSDTYTFRAAR